MRKNSLGYSINETFCYAMERLKDELYTSK